MRPLFAVLIDKLALLESLSNTFIFFIPYCIRQQARLGYEFAICMPMCRKFCCRQGKIQIFLCSFTKYDLKIALIALS